MIAAFISNPSVLLVSVIILVASLSVWIASPVVRFRITALTGLLLLQSANIALTAVTRPAEVQLPLITLSFPVMTLQWVLIALAFMPGPNQSSDAREPTT